VVGERIVCWRKSAGFASDYPLRLRWKITVGIVALVIVCAVLFSRSPNAEQKALAETRRALRQQGFKTDLSDFNFSTSPEERTRAAVLGTTSRAALTNRARPEPIFREAPTFMRPIEADAAIAIWKLD